MPRPHRPGEHTCTCSAYKFPHRFGGGRCTGIFLAEEGWGSSLCKNCPCKYNGGCQVVSGAESVKECRIWQEFVEYWEIKV